MSALRYTLRFFEAGWTLARHGALFILKPVTDRGLALQTFVGLLALVAPLKRRLKNASRGERLVEALQALGPAAIKLGQTFATRPDLIGPEVAEALTALQDRLPAESTAAIIATIEAELGKPIDALFTRFEPKAAAAASIAEVHFAEAEGRALAVKVLRPGIEEKVARDFAAFRWLAGKIEGVSRTARRLRLVEVVETLKRKTEIEMDLRMEAAAACELKESMAGENGYFIPAVDWARTARRVMTMERVTGTPLSRLKGAKAAFDRKKVSATLVRVFLTQALRDGFFHADQHQGNYFIQKDGTLAAVDFGIMGRLDGASRRYLAEIFWGFHHRDYRHVADYHFRAGYVPERESRELFAQAMRALAEPITGRPLKEISLARMLQRLFETAEAFSMETQPQLLTLQRSMMMMEGLAALIDPDVNMWELSRPVIEKWVRRNRLIAGPLRELAAFFTRLLEDFPKAFQRLRAAFANENAERQEKTTA
ncbi:MAG TPA: AarF/UbiB family protein [Sphingomonadales bacterium]|nr:AarF/UbiB family protein [Sphingomonadales bacterium]